MTKLYTQSAANIGEIVAKQDSMNKAAEALPPVMPYELAVLAHADFCAIVQMHQERLLTCWSATEMDIIEQEHQQLLAAYSQEPQLENVVLPQHSTRRGVLSRADSRPCCISAED